MKPGDFVRIRLAREEVEGTILESYDPSIVLLKLKSGYNIGIPRDHLHGEEIISHINVSEKSKKITIELKKGLPNVGLVLTGGTIASKLDTATGAVSALTNIDDLAKFYPKLFEKVNVTKVEVPFLKLSENMHSEDWIVIAKTIAEMLKDKDISGVIVAHGTDTLHYTSAALSFFLRNLGKPVVLTYAQRSIDRGSSDADLNLVCSAKLATSDAAGVYVVGHADMNDDYCYAFLGTKVRKMHTSRRDAFKAINVEPIAKIWPDKVDFLGMFSARTKNSLELDAVFNDKVALVKFYPGQSADIIDYYRMHGFNGIVIEVLGLGNLPNEGAQSWIPAIKKAIREGMVVCAAAQTIYGKLHPGVYSTGRELQKIGVIFLEDMLAETAFVKLGYILAHRGWKNLEKAREKMLENYAGELNGLLTE